MYNVNDLNRQIVFEKEKTSKNAYGTPVEGYSFLKTAFANIRVLSRGSEYNEEGTLPFTRVEFVVRYDPMIDYKCRIQYENQYYEIGHIETMNRKQFLKIRSVVWENQNSNGK